MKNQMQIFENEDFGKIRVVDIGGLPWWVLKDVCKALGLRTPHKVAARLDEDERNLIPLMDGIGREQMTAIVNESGLYAVILRSDKPKARDFRRWITHEVLPSIRKYGAYISDEVLEEMARSQEFSENLLSALQEEKNKKAALIATLDKITPKVLYCEAVLQCADGVQTSILAKDYGMSAAGFNKLLHGLKVQYKIGGTWLLYKNHADKGYTITRTYHINENTTAIHTYWTQRGRLFDMIFSNGTALSPKPRKYKTR